MKNIVFAIFLFFCVLGFSQNKNCNNLSKEDVVVLKVKNLSFKDGTAIQGGDTVSLIKGLTDDIKITPELMECLNIELVDVELASRDWWLEFYYTQNPTEIIEFSHKKISTSLGWQNRSDSDDVLNRKNSFDCSENIPNKGLNLLSLTDQRKNLFINCLGYYFSEDYWMMDKDTITLRDGQMVEGIEIKIDDDQYTFSKQEGIIIINSKSLPESGFMSVYLDIGFSKMTVADRVYLNNIPKIINRLQKEGLSEEEIRAYLELNHLNYEGNSLNQEQKLFIEEKLTQLIENEK